MSAHTDSWGTDEYNTKLSHNRARSVMEYILSKGISSARIIAQGYGETKPVAPNDSEENRQLNRRVEFKILKN
jgi:outer membrane protein OmpA-like peptidoglycan-associated protein